MPRFLLAWEFGGDLGHLRRMLAVGCDLRGRGHEAVLACTDLGALAAAGARDFEALQAPALAPPAAADPSPLNASDILLNLGFGDAAGLAGALSAWSSLLRLVQPSAVIGDYAPTALLAARASGLPRVSIGSGFSTPPMADPMPALRSWIACEASLLAQRDARLLATVREAFGRALPRAAAPARAADVFDAELRIACSWPQLDPFGARADIDYVGPQRDMAAALGAAWRTPSRPRVFAYLKPHDGRFRALIAAIARVAGEAIVAAPGLAPAEAAALSGEKMRVRPEPVALDDVLAGADLCVSHSGAGIASAAARHGVIQALLPLHLEQYLIARRVCEAGWGRMLEPGRPAPDLAQWLTEAVRAGKPDSQPLVAGQSASAAEHIERAVGIAA